MICHGNSVNMFEVSGVSWTPIALSGSFRYLTKLNFKSMILSMVFSASCQLLKYPHIAWIFPLKNDNS